MTIEEVGKSALSEAPKAEPAIDVQDVMIVVGFLSLVCGVATIYWPAALIVAGLLFFAFAWLIQLSRPKDERKHEPTRTRP